MTPRFFIILNRGLITATLAFLLYSASSFWMAWQTPTPDSSSHAALPAINLDTLAAAQNVEKAVPVFKANIRLGDLEAHVDTSGYDLIRSAP